MLVLTCAFQFMSSRQVPHTDASSICLSERFAFGCTPSFANTLVDTLKTALWLVGLCMQMIPLMPLSQNTVSVLIRIRHSEHLVVTHVHMDAHLIWMTLAILIRPRGRRAR